MIRFEGVSKLYGTNTKAVNNIDLHIQEGEILALIGPSGSGKTTTMKMINRLIEPSKGAIYINGTNIDTQDPVDLRRNIGYVIQHVGLLPHMTIAENAALVPKLKNLDCASYTHRVNELLTMVGLDPEVYGKRYPAELSGGQQQRVGVVRALAADPPIILMDEPFSALDPISRGQLQDELLLLQAKLRKTIIFVTHDIDEALKIASRICIMSQGQIIQLDTPDHILRHPANDFVRTFLGSNRLSSAGKLPTIEAVMIKPIVSHPNRGMAEAITTMSKHKVDTLLVTDDDNTLLGVVGVWELQQHYYEEHLTLSEVLDPDITTITNEKTLSEAIYLISKHRIAYLPVTDINGKLLGVITRASLVDVMAKHFGSNIVYPLRAGGAIS